uniref:Vitelline membrane outer layer 1 homolog n=1 Tax=Pseudonaja textilis TaxID=8673 RepID=A0A670XMD9_PSETE
LCPGGYLVTFALRVEPHQKILDDTAVNNIGNAYLSLSFFSRWGTWTTQLFCPKGYLVSFSLKVESHQKILDDTAVNNIQFKCSGGANLIGFGTKWGQFGPWSDSCSVGICGFITRVQDKQGIGDDDTALNDVLFYCC